MEEVAQQMTEIERLPTDMITATIAPFVAHGHPYWVWNWDVMFRQEVFVCSVILYFSAVLCSAAGIGGGGVYVTVLMVFGGLTPHDAVPLSKAVVFLGSLSSLWVNIKRIGECSEDKPVVDFDACRVVVPSALIGTFMGVLLNYHFPDEVVVVLLSIILTIMTGMVLQKAYQQHLEESGYDQSTSREIAMKNRAGDDDEEEIEPLVGRKEPPAKRKTSPTMTLLTGLDASLSGVLLLITILSGIFRFHLSSCRDEKMGLTKYNACSHPILQHSFGAERIDRWMGDDATADVLLSMVMGLPLWSSLAFAAHYGKVTHTIAGWAAQKVLIYQGTSVFTGCAAGLIGIGGGLVLSPFFLLTGMDPAVAVGTSATCVLFTSSSTTMQYIFTDRVEMTLAVVYGGVTAFASYSGTSLVHQLQDRFAGKRSYITLVVAAGIALSALLAIIKLFTLMSTVADDGQLHGHASTEV